MNRRFSGSRLAGALVGALMAMPSITFAQDDLDVTLRIVEDDQELDESFVNQLSIPDSLEDELSGADADGLETGSEDLAGDIRDDMLDIESTLGEQSRETRDALDIELSGELDTQPPAFEDPILDDPDLTPPDLENPDLETPDLGLPDVQTPDLETLNSEN